jgi:ribosomal-protein-alanine N-acetyltransferase
VRPPPASFETERLRCRRTRPEDSPALFAAYATDPEVTRYLVWPPYRELAPLAAFVNGLVAEWDAGQGYRFELCLRGSDTPIGSIHLHPQGGPVSIGYVLARAHWGRGLMAEALRAAADLALAQPEVYRVSCFCDAANTASARVMEKAGLAFEGRLRRFHPAPNLGPEPRDCLLYAKVK